MMRARRRRCLPPLCVGVGTMSVVSLLVEELGKLLEEDRTGTPLPPLLVAMVVAIPVGAPASTAANLLPDILTLLLVLGVVDSPALLLASSTALLLGDGLVGGLAFPLHGGRALLFINS